MNMLEIQNLTVHFKTDNDEVKAVDDISLSVPPGKTVALVGESGSGKSVTALSVLRLVETYASVKTTGKILFNKENVLKYDAGKILSLRGNRIAMIFQEPMTSLNPVYTVGSQIIEPFITHQNLSKEKAKDQSIKMLDKCGIPEPALKMNSYPHQLSGGQRQRVMIAMALACKPDLLIADEPTTALDVTIQAQILELIKEIQTEFGMAVLLITHDLAMVKKIADTVYIMHQGKVEESGDCTDILTNPKMPYTKHLIDSVPKGKPSEKSDSSALISVKNLQVHFVKKTGFFKRKKHVVKAVDNVSISVRKGMTFGIVGESGSGKSTLGLSLLKLVKSRGEIIYGNNDLNSIGRKQMQQLRSELQIVFQDPFSSLSPRLTVGQILSEGINIHLSANTKSEVEKIVIQALDEVGLTADMANRYPHEFSGGQRQRIAIARSIVLQPKFLVLDEPTSALDMTIQAQIIDLLRGLQEKHSMTYLFISHDLRVIRALADDLAVMKDGSIVEAGPAGQIFANPQHPYTKSLFNAAFAN